MSVITQQPSCRDRCSGWIISAADALRRRVRRPENKGSPASSLGLFSPDARCWRLGSVWFTSSSLLPESSSWRTSRQASYSPASALATYTVSCYCRASLVTSADFWRYTFWLILNHCIMGKNIQVHYKGRELVLCQQCSFIHLLSTITKRDITLHDINHEDK